MKIDMIDDTELKNTGLNSCSRCRHLYTDSYKAPFTCDAFPKGIPDEIWKGDNDHKKPYKGDHGIRFEKI